MSRMRIAANAYTPSFQDNKDISKKNSLNEIAFPQTESVEHAMFTQKFNNAAYQDIYNIDDKLAARKVEDAKIARQLTGTGPGAG